jgi:hypothetical protein
MQEDAMRNRSCLAAIGVVVGLVVLCMGGVDAAAPSESAAPAHALSLLMTRQHLDAIGARDPSAPDRFVAALYFAGSQLLVVAERYPAPAHLQELLEQRDYRQMYVDLQGSPDASDQVFFQDLQADGLSPDSRESADILYEHSTDQTIFDDGWRKQRNLGERDYLEKFRRADALYASLLKQLIAAVESSATQ